MKTNELNCKGVNSTKQFPKKDAALFLQRLF